jgi:hypothetical protein
MYNGLLLFDHNRKSCRAQALESTPSAPSGASPGAAAGVILTATGRLEK